MQSGVNFDQELADAEAALLKAESDFGLNDVRVSYALDNIARMLREKGLRTLDAVNMEARAKAIRIAANKADMAKVTPQMRDVSDAVKHASKRQAKEKSNRVLVMTASFLLVAVIVGRYFLAPSPSERKSAEAIMNKVKEVLPTTIVQNMVSKGQQAAKDVEVANKKHNDEIDKVLGGDLTGMDGQSGK